MERRPSITSSPPPFDLWSHIIETGRVSSANRRQRASIAQVLAAGAQKGESEEKPTSAVRLFALEGIIQFEQLMSSLHGDIAVCMTLKNAYDGSTETGDGKDWKFRSTYRLTGPKDDSRLVTRQKKLKKRTYRLW
ncbi:MAG: hypothetical protein Q9219_007301 [cf. Caloplaca sp. 3 TL-2023]